MDTALRVMNEPELAALVGMRINHELAALPNDASLDAQGRLVAHCVWEVASVVLDPKATFVESARPGNYDSLRRVLDAAYTQAAEGKGAQRHGQNRPFEDQPMQQISTLLGGHTGLLYQAMKKTQESVRLDKGAAVQELLGAIVYLAGAILNLEKSDDQEDV